MFTHDIGLNTLKPGGIAAFASKTVAVRDLNFKIFALQNCFANFGRKIFPRSVKIKSELFAETIQRYSSIIGLIILGVLVVGGVGYYLYKRRQKAA